MSTYILSLDAGTTSSRAILFDHSGNIIATEQQEFTQLYPKTGWVEHDATEIWNTQLKVAKNVLLNNNITPEQIASIGITNQRETTVVWNKETGEPIFNAIVWQDRRTSEYCNALKKEGWANKIQEKTGLVIDAYFSGTKLRWILNNVEGAKTLAEQNKLAFGTVDSWLLYKLTDGKVHKTDATNASRTMLFNIHKNCWDDELLELMSIPPSCLPKVCNSSEVYGSTILLGGSITISGIAGDQQSALFGQLCTEPGMVKNTYGTGCFMLMHTGKQAVKSENNLLTTIALRLNNTNYYALEGSVFIGGAVVQWLRDELEIISSSSEVEALAGQVKDSAGVYIVPAFAGLGAPHWNQEARGSMFGLTRGAGKKHIARAAIESIAYQSADLVESMLLDSKGKIKALKVDGGATANDMLMQFQSDIINTEVIRPVVTETTALGAAYLAGLAVGFWESVDSLKDQWQIEKSFYPKKEKTEVTNLKDGWKKAVQATLTYSS